MLHRLLLSLNLLLPALINVNGQECLSNPASISHSLSDHVNDVEWTKVEDGVYKTTITFDATVYDKSETGFPCSFVTRSHNYMHPSPTLVMRPGMQYIVTLLNNLGPEAAENALKVNNQLRDPNHTNIHLHGLHISGLAPGDAIDTLIEPGGSHSYVFNIPCNHFSGVFWWHPHHHGSTSLQVGGGANGVLVIEQESDLFYKYYETIPSWLYKMDEIILAVFYWDVQFNSRRPTDYTDIDFLSSFTDDEECSAVDYRFFTINGKYQPTICLMAGEWKRLRIAYIEGERPLNLFIQDIATNDTNPNETLSDNCQLYLVAKDGHWLHSQTPRSVPHMLFSPAGRAEVLINCVSPVSGDGEYTLSLIDGRGNIVSYISVTGSATEVEFDLADAEYAIAASRAEYLPDLMDVTGIANDSKLVKSIDRDNINGVPYSNNVSMFSEYLELDSINEWELDAPGPRGHPFHMHILAFQVINADVANVASTLLPTNWHVDGDYYDTFMFKGTMRFKTTTFGGIHAYHCHITHHSDIGSFAVAEVNDGCDNEWNDFGSVGSCVIPQCPSNVPDRLDCDLTNSYVIGEIEQCDSDPCDCDEDNLHCDDGDCKEDKGCKHCEDGYFKLDDNYKCHDCQETFGDGCSVCKDSVGCSSCASGYDKVYGEDCDLWYCVEGGSSDSGSSDSSSSDSSSSSSSDSSSSDSSSSDSGD